MDISLHSALSLSSAHHSSNAHLVQDIPGALSEAQVAEALGLHDIRGRAWAIYKTSAIKGEGLFEGLDWLSTHLTK